MSKKCARCDRTVYPLEELKCLDKIWHKTCFKCQECGMTLNMRTYKGFNRQPYCNAHCPQAKHTTVADTPEIRRIQENTKIQSTVKYHEDFEKQKGKVTQIADDPETLRIKQNTRIISNVAYHGDLEKKAIMEQKRPNMPEKNGDAYIEEPPGKEEVYPTPLVQSVPPVHAVQSCVQPQPIPTHVNDNRDRDMAPTQAKHGPQQHVYANRSANVDSGISKDSPYSTRQASTVIYTSEHGPVSNPSSRHIGSIADYDPINEHRGSLVMSGQRNDVNAQMEIPLEQDWNSQQIQQQPVQKVQEGTYRAMYDYIAADVDEVSFKDGDIILHCTPIDEGWMTGRVKRTGQTGMLPANYVEMIN